LAGALTGLGDDATGAWTNPGGLTHLARREVSVEWRSFEYRSEFTSGGHDFGPPTGLGVDTVAGLVTGESRRRANAISFASMVIPGDRWAIAFYRSNAASFTSSIDTEGAYFTPGAGLVGRLRPATGELNVDVVNYGVSGAWRLGKRLSAGLGVSIYTFSIESEVNRYCIVCAASTAPGGPFGPPLKTAGNVLNIETQKGDDTAPGLNAGMSLQLSEQVILGASYRQGPEFLYDAQRIAGPASRSPGIVEQNVHATFKVPDVYAIGLVVRPATPLILAFDYRRVQYSQMVDKFAVVAGAGVDEVREFTVDDGHELRGGVEYAFANLRTPIILRGGAWFDPDHHIRFEPRDGRPRDNSLVFRPGDDVVHATGGIGVAFSRFQIDAGVDYAKPMTAVSVSAVVRF
jgi:long-subunit fatty acid transport protein